MSDPATIAAGILGAALPHVIDAVREGLTGEQALERAIERMRAADPGGPIDGRLRALVEEHLARVRGEGG